jgi:serine phosphatase RsbU (regulator of sigma subunit)
MDTLKVGVCIWELEQPNTPASLRLLVCNPAAARFLGVKQENVVGKLINEGFPGALDMPLAAIFTRIAETGESMALGEVPYTDEVVPEGVFTIHAHALPNKRTCVEFTNVTERIQAEKKVAEKHEALTKALADLWSEMDLARKIQTVLLPDHPKVSGFEVASEMVPAATVGGDYVDIFDAGDSTWILIGDVSGHGVSAGLIMMMIQTAVRTAVSCAKDRGEDTSPSRILSIVNSSIRNNLAKIGNDQYMTINALRLRDGKVEHSGLHQDLFVYRAASQTVETIETEGVWLGVVDDAARLLVDKSFVVNEGDMLLAYTDGLTETLKDFGPDSVRDLFCSLARSGLSANAITKELLGRVTGPQQRDDVTVLVAARRAKGGCCGC